MGFYNVKCVVVGNVTDNWEKASNLLLSPMRRGLGYQIWDAKNDQTTKKAANVALAILSFTLLLIPTLIGLALWKISKTVPQNCATMKAAAQIAPAMKLGEAIYGKFETATDSDKETLKAYLGSVYSDLHLRYFKANTVLPKALEKTAARMFFLMGRCLYGGNMVASQRMFQLSVTILGNDVFKVPSLRHCDQLKNLPQTLDNSPEFDQMDKFIMGTSAADLVERVSKMSYERAFALADSIRQVGATYQNIDSFKSDLPRFEKYFGVPKAVFAKLDTPDSRWEVADLIYNTGRLIHYLGNPGDVQGALQTLDEMLPYLEKEGDTLRAQVKRAQIHNITAIEMNKIQPRDAQHKQAILKSQYASMSKASEIASVTPGFNAFLKIMFLNNKARSALDCAEAGVAVATDKEIGQWFEEVLTTIKSENYNHYYHGAFVSSAARLAIREKRKQDALALLDLAQTINAKYPASSADLQKRVDDLRKEALKLP